MVLLRSLLFVLVFHAGTAVAVLAATVASPLGARVLKRVVAAWFGWFHHCARLLVGVRLRVTGALPHGPAIVAAKHQSMFETLELVRLLGWPAVVAKRELADIPLWGAIARRWG